MNDGAAGSTFACGKKPVIDAMLAMLNEMVKAATTAIKKRNGVAWGTRFKGLLQMSDVRPFAERKHLKDLEQPELGFCLYQS